MARKMKKMGHFGEDAEYKHGGHGTDTHSMHGQHGDGAMHNHASAKAAHPHRGPAGMKMGMMGKNQDRATNMGNEHLTLDGHTFGEDECYGSPGSAHHMGDNVCEED